MTVSDLRRSSVWSRYWASGLAHSCPGTVDDRLTGGFADFWRGALAGLGRGDRVLEIGCGNAAVSRLVVGGTVGSAPEVDAIDVADVRPAWIASLEPAAAERIRIHARTPVERLPFEAGRFSAVVGQYAFEYAQRDAAVAEVVRCSRPGARLALVLHHAASAVVRMAVEERAQLQWLTAPGGLLAAAGGLLADLAVARDPREVARLQHDAAAEQRRQRYNAVQAEVERRMTSSLAAALLDEGAHFAARTVETARREGEAPARTLLVRQAEAFADLDVRLEEVASCALDEGRLAALVDVLRRAGYAKIETGTLHEQGRLMGWTLVAALPSHAPA